MGSEGDGHLFHRLQGNKWLRLREWYLAKSARERFDMLARPLGEESLMRGTRLMDGLTLENFRSFREQQTARLAPLTLLVGENSTGKTSFLAMIRALWDIAYRYRVPDFKEDPYDLGSFDEIAHHRGGGGGRAKTFGGGFSFTPRAIRNPDQLAIVDTQPHRIEVTFEQRGTAPSPVRIRLSHEEIWFEGRLRGQSWQLSFGTPRGAWRLTGTFAGGMDTGYDLMLPPLFHLLSRMTVRDRESKARLTALQGAKLPSNADRRLLERLAHDWRRSRYYGMPLYASAPVRSKPRRTYDPARPTPDPEGDYVPMYLASIYFQDPDKWKGLKSALESFGKAAGLFDEISIKPLGRRDSEPFQVQIRRYGNRAKGPQRNLIDVGYGVSQVLPVVTELLRDDAPHMFLLQQPEVHLHPTAQAALGSLFCQVAKRDRQLIVETHSDYLLDRIRMDVRDGTTPLNPGDVSILFFDRGDLDVQIHSLRVDREGNVLDAPQSYRRFFLQETRRSLGL